jgi:hypothetical protein
VLTNWQWRVCDRPKGEGNETKKKIMSMNRDYSELNVTTIFSTELRTAKGADLKLIPRGTFAGTIYGFGLLDNGWLTPADTGEQGGGQN